MFVVILILRFHGSLEVNNWSLCPYLFIFYFITDNSKYPFATYATIFYSTLKRLTWILGWSKNNISCPFYADRTTFDYNYTFGKVPVVHLFSILFCDCVCLSSFCVCPLFLVFLYCPLFLVFLSILNCSSGFL